MSNHIQEPIPNLPPSLLSSTKVFYATRVKAGSMSVSYSDGTWSNDYSLNSFEAYLSRFSDSDRAKITEGAELLAQTQTKTTKLLTQLISGMHTDEVTQLIKDLSS